jgi:LacI family transcriptional regulator
VTTIREVAQRAGVAPITVSRVINHSGYVNKATRARVEAAIADLGYVPNTLARSLRSKRTQTLGLVLSDITNPFWTTVARGVEDTASRAGFNVIFCNTDESESKGEQYLQILLQKQVDGVLLVPAGAAARQVAWVQEQGVPVVVLDRLVPGAQVDTVRGDSERGAYDLVRLLLDLGHRRIAMLSGPPDVSTAADRVKGYCRALHEAGLEEGAELIFYGRYTRASGYEMAQKALAASPRPQALFAGNNFIADGAVEALREARLRVPEELAMVVFDRMPIAWSCGTFVATAEQPAYEMGIQATELLLARLKGEMPGAFQDIVLPVRIISGQTASS